jgi:alpha-tubulin suppressor-like RCC1 family protein
MDKLACPPRTPISSLPAGGDHSLGLKADGSIVAWGDNILDQNNVPSPNTGFTAIAESPYFHSLGLKADGSVVAWGSNFMGEADVPAPNTGFTAIAGGTFLSLGLKIDGSIVAWGDDRLTNIPAPNADFVAIAAGSNSLGLKVDGSIVAWGSHPSTQGRFPFPNTGFVAIAASRGQRLAIRLQPGDFDGDGSVDGRDVYDFVLRQAGPEVEPQPERWRFLDLDDDFDVDLADFRVAQNSYTGG